MSSFTPSHKSFAAAASNDAALLARLVDCEPSPDLIERLRKVPVADWFGVRLASLASQRGAELLEHALSGFASPPTAAEIDALAADFAAIHLVNTYRATPTESPWLDPEGLERQGPMFALARIYRQHGLAVPDRGRRSEDHLVVQLDFLAHLLTAAQSRDELGDVARYLDAHLLLWIDRFAERVSARCDTPYHAGLVTLLAGYLDDLRTALAVMSGVSPPTPEETAEAAKRLSREIPVEPGRYVPGTAPSW